MRLAVVLAALTALVTSTAAARADGPIPPAPASPSESFLLGASVGALAPVLFQPGLFDGVNPGVSVSVNAGYRFARYFYLGAVYQHGFLSGGSWDGAQTTSASTDYVGLNFVTISAPDARVALFTEVGAGYRMVTMVDVVTGAGLPPDTQTEAGPELTFLGLGVEVNLADHVRIVPEVTLAAGSVGLFGFLGVAAYFDFAGSARR